MKIEEYAQKYTETDFFRKTRGWPCGYEHAVTLDDGIRIGLRAAKCVYLRHEMEVPSGAFQAEIDRILAGTQDLPETEGEG